jgi:WxL domain surface cell wall-binding
MLTFMGAVLAAAALASPAAAATSTVTGTVSAGTLSLTTTATPSFGITLDGTDQTAGYTVPTTVTDATGSGNGWNLTITSTQFTTGSQTLSATASTITSVASSCVTTCTNPTNAVALPITVPAGATPPAAVKYFNAAAATGRGRFSNTPTVSVSLPASTLAGTYSSTLTLSAVSGP